VYDEGNGGELLFASTSGDSLTATRIERGKRERSEAERRKKGERGLISSSNDEVHPHPETELFH